MVDELRDFHCSVPIEANWRVLRGLLMDAIFSLLQLSKAERIVIQCAVVDGRMDVRAGMS